MSSYDVKPQVSTVGSEKWTKTARSSSGSVGEEEKKIKFKVKKRVLERKGRICFPALPRGETDDPCFPTAWR